MGNDEIMQGLAELAEFEAADGFELCGEAIAEFEGERAAFGDGPPGSALLASYARAALRRIGALRASLPVEAGPALPVAVGVDPPF